ncbi:Cysteine desulfuration protein SufE [Methylobacterium cerastii]|uniref:Cysteine desulfuration protein SufE n=1 Tax=Methylobacterium cerastii TaxID=932741 RepID=A0ABQ4QCS1_9HYPH|nr:MULTISPECIES: SufE family protein [Methylobacterium]TXN11300.1 SufE family protein [Methylobacterium sp. WL122]TXM66348.1 SufE family protein [Methylobacterium sp. WL12]TXN03625.1 SufE family protein [Methylobacterium sp. WL103]TXN83614.1 SufE family protein [Methylobacterium sp. WL8]GJD42991.1 Cysteine desulfuration protein SufE [Methylobacterium cerastii]
MLPPIETIVENFEFIDDWEERYRYLIELGRTLPPADAALHAESNKVLGCASQVWIDLNVDASADVPRLHLRGDSDAHIVRGLVALMVALFDGKTPREAADTDAFALYTKLGLGEHLTPQRSNGVRAMADRIHRDAVRLAA